MILGLDFDNTLISYDELFHKVATGRQLIPETTPRLKNAVRNCLRQQGMEEEWIRLQGEVYGARILEAEPYPGMFDTLRLLSARRVPMRIVSHKTRTPYLGENHDLHAAARSWLASTGFHDPGGLGWSPDQVFFELTKDAKIARIIEQGCTHYVDDLPEILEMLPDSVEKILFAGAEVEAPPNWRLMRSWHELPALLSQL